MEYEKRMELEAKKKKNQQFLGLIVVIVLLLVGGYFAYQWQSGRQKRNFETLAKETLDSVYENYKNDKMMGEDTKDKEFTFPDTSIMNFNDRMLKGGSITQYADGDVAFVLYNKDWCAIKTKKSQIEIIDYDSETCVRK